MKVLILSHQQTHSYLDVARADFSKRMNYSRIKKAQQKNSQQKRFMSKVHLTILGESVSISLYDRYQLVGANFLCEEVVFTDDIHSTLSVAVDGTPININWDNADYCEREFVASEEWTTTKQLDWNRSLNKLSGAEYSCVIECEGDFDVQKLRYNVAHPITVRVGETAYKYNRPLLMDISYDGVTYRLSQYIKTGHFRG